jgi:hypothetical protein
VHERLRERVKWHEKCIIPDLGSPSRSIEGRLRDDDGSGTKSTAPLQLPSNPRVEEMNELIEEMGIYDATFVRAIRIKYLGRNTMIHESKILGISLPTVKKDLERAKVWLAARLNVKIARFNRN